jgi:hypothetical protein
MPASPAWTTWAVSPATGHRPPPRA